MSNTPLQNALRWQRALTILALLLLTSLLLCRCGADPATWDRGGWDTCPPYRVVCGDDVRPDECQEIKQAATDANQEIGVTLFSDAGTIPIYVSNKPLSECKQLTPGCGPETRGSIGEPLGETDIVREGYTIVAFRVRLCLETIRLAKQTHTSCAANRLKVWGLYIAAKHELVCHPILGPDHPLQNCGVCCPEADTVSIPYVASEYARRLVDRCQGQAAP